MTDEAQNSELLAKLLAGEASPGEAVMLGEWRLQSPANRAYFDGCASLFELSDKDFEGYDKDVLWKDIAATITDKKISGWPAQIKRVVGIAASVVLLAGIGWLLHNLLKRPAGPDIYTAQSLAKKIQLSDTSIVILAPHSTLSVYKDFGKLNRRVRLAGSASFSVIHDRNKPFIVDLNILHINDLGTKFSVVSAADSDTVHVAVQEGKVAVYDDSHAFAPLTAGQAAYYLMSTEKITVLAPEQNIVPSVIKPAHTTTQRPAPVILQPVAPANKFVYQQTNLLKPTLTEITTIIGQSAMLVNTDSAKGGDFTKYNYEYRATDKTSPEQITQLICGISYYINTDAAQKIYEAMVPTGMTNIDTLGDQAFYDSRQDNLQTLIIRRRNIIISIRVHPFMRHLPNDKLLAAARRLVSEIK